MNSVRPSSRRGRCRVLKLTRRPVISRRRRAARAQTPPTEVFNSPLNTMEHPLQLQTHVSIQNRYSHPLLKKCENCCTPSRIHCPFCQPSIFKPAKLYAIRDHMEHHFRKAISAGKFMIHRCALDCRDHPHYHCLYCPRTLIRKLDFRRHLYICYKTFKQAALKAQADGRLAPSAKLEIPSLDWNMDDVEELNASSDSDQHSGSHPLSSHGGVNVQKKPTTCHQTVQTNFDQPKDCDEFYFLNLAKLFKKLSNQKKADVRLKIEHILLEAGFE